MHAHNRLVALSAIIVITVVSGGLVSVSAAGIPADRAYAYAGNTAAARSLSDQAIHDPNARDAAYAADQEATPSGTMPDNPEASLPSQVSEAIPDDATVVSENLVVTPGGEVKDIETGDTVTDARLVGTPDAPADPLAKTDGKSFIPVDAESVKNAVADNSGDSPAPASNVAYKIDGAAYTAAQTPRDATSYVRTAALQGNQYGAYWGTYNGSPAFFEADGTLFAQQAKGVIDVSEWQGTIDWAKVKKAGVQGAIIRLSFGSGNRLDRQVQRNVAECKRLGIPFGIYMYSYAESAEDGNAEGEDTVAKLRQIGVTPKDLSYPVYYDTEDWTGGWSGHTAPTDPNVWNGAVNNWFSKLKAAGYADLSVYSYPKYLKSALNKAEIWAKTRWIASYGPRAGFEIATNDRGWQYTSSGSVDGIDGTVDLNAFGVKTAPKPSVTPSAPTNQGSQATVITNGWVGSGDSLRWYENGKAVASHAFYDPASKAWYWADADGSIARDKDVFIPKDESDRSKGGKWVRFDANRHMVKGEDYRYGGWYWFDPVTGEMAKGMKYIPSNGGKWVYYDWVTGQMAHGERYVNYDAEHTGWYYFDPVTGKMAHGMTWVPSNGGKWVYYDPVTGKMQHGKRVVNGKTYYFDRVTGARK